MTCRLSPSTSTSRPATGPRRSTATSAKASRAAEALPPVWFYDERGSELFDEITRLPEYYLTRAERSILAAHAARSSPLRCRHAGRAGLGHVGEDTAAARRDGRRRDRSQRFVPFDVSEETCGPRRTTIAGAVRLDVHAVVGDFHRHLDAIPRDRAAAWWPSSAARSATSTPSNASGSSSTSLRHGRRRPAPARHRPREGPRPPRRRLRRRGRRHRRVQPQRARGCSTEELGADFDPTRSSTSPAGTRRSEWIEMRLRSTRPRVRDAGLDLEVTFARARRCGPRSRPSSPRGLVELVAGRLRRRAEVDRSRGRLPAHAGPPVLLSDQAFQVLQVLPRTYW